MPTTEATIALWGSLSYYSKVVAVDDQVAIAIEEMYPAYDLVAIGIEELYPASTGKDTSLMTAYQLVFYPKMMRSAVFVEDDSVLSPSPVAFDPLDSLSWADDENPTQYRFLLEAMQRQSRSY